MDGRPGVLEPGSPTAEDEQKVHAFITLAPERARAQAEEVDRKLSVGEDPGPLAGIPFTVKDIFAVQGTPTTAASKILANFTAPYTATPVERMEAAGGVMLGKVNLDEFTYGSSSESSAFQPSPRNPWNPARVPGGSSGGSTASVAAGEAPLSLGTDTAGSVRQPAAFCGVVGVKPTYGRVSRYGMIAFGSSLDCPGPVARNVVDAALMLQTIAGRPARLDRRQRAGRRLPGRARGGRQRSAHWLIAGLFPHRLPRPGDGRVHSAAAAADIEAAVRSAAEVLAELGAEIVEDVPMPNTRYGVPAYFVVSRVRQLQPAPL